jgi:hypothetical protein
MNPQAAASATLSLIVRAFAFINGHVDVSKLAEVVMAAEAETPGLQGAAAAIKANEVAIFKTELGRYAADEMLGVLIDAQKHPASPPAA